LLAVDAQAAQKSQSVGFRHYGFRCACGVALWALPSPATSL
jgi:hypothetical protein